MVCCAVACAGVAASLDSPWLTPMVLLPDEADEPWVTVFGVVSQLAIGAAVAIRGYRIAGMRAAAGFSSVVLLLLSVNGFLAFAMDWGPKQDPRVTRLLWGLALQGLMLIAAVVWLRHRRHSLSSARASAEAWVKLVDQGDGEVSWRQAAVSFKTVTPSQKWMASVQHMRRTLGPRLWRRFRRGTATHLLPTGQRGEFMLLEFDSAFGHRTGACESIALVLESDGQWRVVWYDIKEAS